MHTGLRMRIRDFCDPSSLVRLGQLHRQQGALNANRVEILNSGDVIRFEQGVTMLLNLEHGEIDRKGNSP